MREPALRVRRLMAGQRILNPPFEGSIPSAPTSAVVARVAEQRTFNPLGTGSSPVDGTDQVLEPSEGSKTPRRLHSSVAKWKGARLLIGILQVRFLPLELVGPSFESRTPSAKR